MELIWCIAFLLIFDKTKVLKLWQRKLLVNTVHVLLIQLIYLWNKTFRLILDKLSFTAVNFIRSDNNPALLQLFMVLGLSECMLLIQNMLKVFYNNLWMPIYSFFRLTIIVYVQ